MDAVVSRVEGTTPPADAQYFVFLIGWQNRTCLLNWCLANTSENMKDTGGQNWNSNCLQKERNIPKAGRNSAGIWFFFCTERLVFEETVGFQKRIWCSQ